MTTSWNPLIKHRGPFQFQLSRAVEAKGKKHSVQTEAVAGLVEGPDVWDEAKALLEDPRDTITSISVWAVGKGDPYHIFTITKASLAQHLAQPVQVAEVEDGE